MEMTGERRLPAPRTRVWAALNDPDILKACIPGCRSLEATGDGGFRATASVKIGPIATSFSGEVRLLDLVPPESYRIEGSGQGGPAGFARGGAAVTLAEDGSGTLLGYRVKAEVGGKIAQLGARLIDATARQMADQFFDNFAGAVAVSAAAEAPALPAPAAFDVLAATRGGLFGYPLIAWVAAAVFLFIAFSLLAGSL